MAFSLILDLIIVAIMALCVFFSAKRGFVRTLLEIVGFVAAFVIAFTVSSPLADMTYDNIIGPSIISSVEDATGNLGSDVSDQVWNTLPSIIRKNSEKFGIKKDTFTDKVQSYVSMNTEDHAEKISKNVTKPVVVKLVGAIYSVVIVILLIFLSKFLARVINKLFSFSLVGKVNAILGGAVGLLKGAAFSVIFCMLVSIVIIISKNGFLIFNEETIASSYLFKIFYGFSPFV
ncbi:MAG: CvpA family protein [Clostridia bacterium]|nr:CvpA family protein [Clostridia bacterium]